MVRSLAVSSSSSADSHSHESKSGNTAAVVVLAIIAILAVSALLVALAYYLYMRRKVKKTSEKALKSQRPISDSFTRPHAQNTAIETSAAQVFTYKQLQAATNNFDKDNLIGHGGFGSVFRGVLADGKIAAIKQLDQTSKQGDFEFRVELITALSKVLSPFSLFSIGNLQRDTHTNKRGRV